MILIKLNNNINFKSLLIDFYLIMFALFITIFINTKQSFTLSSDVVPKLNHNNNNNFFKITTKIRRNYTNDYRHEYTTKKPQINFSYNNKQNNFKNIPFIKLTSSKNYLNFNTKQNELETQSNIIENNLEYNLNRTDYLNTNFISEIDYIGYNQTSLDATNSFDSDHTNHYWALILLLFPISTIFGNSLVVLSVIKEKNLRTVTNYFVVSLALADLTVAAAVMPFAVYYEVKKKWLMSKVLCDAWVATDVMASTASILNLVAIAIDRFIAVTQPLKYARHKNSNRIYIMIGFVWLLSIAIASPLLAGLNDTPDREIDQCSFNNEKFLIYSSMLSFYIPTIAMIILYYKIFRVIRSRAKKSTAKLIHRKPGVMNHLHIHNHNHNHNNNKNNLSCKSNQTKQNETSTPMIELSQNKSSNESSSKNAQNNNKNKNNNNKISLISAGIFKLKNKTAQSTAQFDLDRKESSKSLLKSSSNNNNNNNDNNNNQRSDEVNETKMDCLENKKTPCVNETIATQSKNREKSLLTNTKSLTTTDKSKSGNNNKRLQSKGKLAINVLRAQSIPLSAVSSNKERKVTKTLAIVLIVFLVCWSPFFAVNNLMKGICKEYKINCSFIKDEFISFLTWLGYLNSLLNPIIYTIFNIEFRKAFAKILAEYCCKNKT